VVPPTRRPAIRAAWLTTTANRKAMNRIQRENKRDDKQKDAHMAPGSACEEG
jgi:RNA polymerase sigma-70 factor (ECF subfamily)